MGRTSDGALVFGIGPSSGRPVPGVSAQRQEPEVAPRRVRRGDRHAHEDRSAALGRTILGSSARAIHEGSGLGTRGPCEVEVDADGRVNNNGVELGVPRPSSGDGPARGDDPGRG